MVVTRAGGLFAVLALGAAAAAGFGTATLRTSLVAHEVLERPAFGASLAGFIETRESASAPTGLSCVLSGPAARRMAFLSVSDYR